MLGVQWADAGRGATKVKPVRFACKRCNVESSVQTEEGEDVYSVCDKVRREHERNSPNCMGDLSAIKLLDASEDSNG
jgi:hypothetical protein